MRRQYHQIHYLCIMFKQRVDKYIKDKSLFNKGDKVLVALSGGADSVALFRVLLDLGIQCEVAHCNFHLRGKESERDENFVCKLCESLSVSLHVKHFATEEYAHSRRISIEMAARELRYQWFEQLRIERDAAVIAVAHHRDDSVETFLLNLIRGTGINGLKGISAKNGWIVRPLLDESRESVLDYLQYIGQDYVTDSTNLQDVYMRNKIRLHLLPMMKELNPSVSESIFQTASHLSAVANIYNESIKENIQEITEYRDGELWIHFNKIKDSSRVSSLVFELLHPYGFNSSQIREICLSMNTQSGKRFRSVSHEVLRDRDSLVIRSLSENRDCTPELIYEWVDITPDFIIPRDKHIACVDADKVKYPLTVRLWQDGDKFYPFGMKGKKNVSDYLINRKFTLFQKEKQYVACSEEQIVWLIGERIDNRFRITETSNKALIIRIKQQ